MYNGANQCEEGPHLPPMDEYMKHPIAMYSVRSCISSLTLTGPLMELQRNIILSKACMRADVSGHPHTFDWLQFHPLCKLHVLLALTVRDSPMNEYAASFAKKYTSVLWILNMSVVMPPPWLLCSVEFPWGNRFFSDSDDLSSPAITRPRLYLSAAARNLMFACCQHWNFTYLTPAFPFESFSDQQQTQSHISVGSDCDCELALEFILAKVTPI